MSKEKGIMPEDLKAFKDSDLDFGLPPKRNFLTKSEFCLGEEDVEILKRYLLGALKRIEIYSKDQRLSDAQKTELLHAFELCCEDLTTHEAYQYYLKNK